MSILTFHVQITVTVPITLMTPMSESGQAIFPQNHIHKIFSSISSNVEDVSVRYPINWIILNYLFHQTFYPITSLTNSEMVSAIGEIKRVSGDPQLTETYDYYPVEVNHFQSDNVRGGLMSKLI